MGRDPERPTDKLHNALEEPATEAEATRSTINTMPKTMEESTQVEIFPYQ